MKQKKCRICGTPFTPTQPLQQVCSPVCAIAKAVKDRTRKEAKETRAERNRIKTRAEWAREAQAAFNKWIRLRDHGQPCISCGRHHQGQMHAGHYLSVGARPESRFNEFNVHTQCAPCNSYLSGNIAMYRINLIKKIGLEAVEELEGPHEAKKYTIEELKEIKAKYTRLARELEKEIQQCSNA